MHSSISSRAVDVQLFQKEMIAHWSIFRCLGRLGQRLLPKVHLVLSITHTIPHRRPLLTESRLPRFDLLRRVDCILRYGCAGSRLGFGRVGLTESQLPFAVTTPFPLTILMLFLFRQLNVSIRVRVCQNSSSSRWRGVLWFEARNGTNFMSDARRALAGAG